MEYRELEKMLGANKMVCRYADRLCDGLKTIGINEDYTISVTDYGTSCYIVLYPQGEKLKIRISDHSVENRGRMSDEMHIRIDRDINELVTSIDRLYNPDNYIFVPKKDGRYLCDGVRGVWVKGE